MKRAKSRQITSGTLREGDRFLMIFHRLIPGSFRLKRGLTAIWAILSFRP